jgi:DNA-binding LacI/PurR family transcriptional regulator
MTLTLKDKIENKGINKSWLAKKIGIPQSTLSHYLNGTRTMSDEINNKIVSIIK